MCTMKTSLLSVGGGHSGLWFSSGPHRRRNLVTSINKINTVAHENYHFLDTNEVFLQGFYNEDTI